MFRHIVLTSVSVLALTAAANAADMYVPGGTGGYKDEFVPVAAWTGFYVGVNGGYGWSADDSVLSGSANYCSTAPCSVPGHVLSSGTLTNTFGSDGEFAGGQIGYNFQPAGTRYVFGVEADIQGSWIKGDGTLSFPSENALMYGTNELDWFGTVRGRVGYAFDRTLIYATGGVAFGGVKNSLTVQAASGTPNPVTVSSSATETGYVVGAGIEHYILPTWSIKAEYQYIDLGSDKLSASAGPTSLSAASTGNVSGSLKAENNYDTVRIGLNYHFLPNYEPLK